MTKVALNPHMWATACVHGPNLVHAGTFLCM